MSKAFIAAILQDSLDCTAVVARQAADDLVAAIVRELKKEGSYTLPGFGTFRVAKTLARKARNPATGESIRVRAGKTVRFKVSPALRTRV